MCGFEHGNGFHCEQPASIALPHQTPSLQPKSRPLILANWCGKIVGIDSAALLFVPLRSHNSDVRQQIRRTRSNILIDVLCVFQANQFHLINNESSKVL
ncbi:hypothetical protein PsorP6_014587 [Peronosclerospora sorghi]|uniref:Uncharacterized protein n=1 Tax=Peronosclerospora sorghi TaxID=230839 RepID=A0ACC0VTE7_9STRA|nr:hypothetical protein PsorP6_014587 [Peronosclerospora sorghi]